MRILKVCIGDPRSGIKGDAKLVVERTKRLEMEGYVVDILYVVANLYSFKSSVVASRGQSRVGMDIECRIGLATMLRGISEWREYSMCPIQTWFSYIAGHGYCDRLIRIYRGYDLVHFYHIRSCGLICKGLDSTNGILDLIDSYTLNLRNKVAVTRSRWARLLLKEELGRITRLEGNIDNVVQNLARCVILTVTDRDASYINSEVCKKVVVPVGVDISEGEVQRRFPARGEGLSLIFFGNLNYEPNENASKIVIAASRRIREVWGERVKVVIAGRFISRSLRREAQGEGIAVYSPVEDMEKLVRSCDVAVLPMISGSGMQSKVLESVAWGCLLMTTRRAAEPIGLVEDKEYIKAETASEIIEKVGELMRGRIDPDQIRENSLSRVKGLDWRVTVKRLCEVYVGLRSARDEC